MSNNRKPGGRPATPPPGANLTRRIEATEESVRRIESQMSDMMLAFREIAGDVKRALNQESGPRFQPAIPQMSEAEVEEFKEHAESVKSTLNMQDIQREQDEMDRLGRERKVRISIDEPDVFVYAGERWIFTEVGAEYIVPETI